MLGATRDSTSSDSDPDDDDGVWTRGAPTSNTKSEESRSDIEGLDEVRAELRGV